ncbi:putative transcription factor interactor and regulator CCHC(Zn) family [Helianthus anomalus]
MLKTETCKKYEKSQNVPSFKNKQGFFYKYQNFHTMKRQTCFNYGTAGHIARNCVQLPSTQSKKKIVQNQKVRSNRYRCSESVMTEKSKTMKNNYRKTKPSDQDWNAAKY